MPIIAKAARGPVILASLLALAPMAGHAQAWIKPGEETLAMRLGGLTSRISSTVRLDGNGNGSVIDLEGDTGMDNGRNVLFVSGTLRLGARHRIDALYDDKNTRSGTRYTEREYVIDDIVEPAGTALSAESESRIFYLGYRYSLLKTPDAELAAGLGAYGGNFKFKFRANEAGLNVDESTTVPLPVLTLSGDWYLTERMLLRAGVNGLKVKVNDVDGSVLAASVAGEYLLTNNFGIGLALEYFDLAADATKGDFRGRAELETSKALLYLTGRF